MGKPASRKSTATMMTHRGLMIGVPLMVSLVFSGAYAALHRPINGRSTSATQGAQTTSKAQANESVATPPAANKLSTQETPTDASNTATTNTNTAQSQNNEGDVSPAQQTVKKTAPANTNSSSVKLNTKL